MAETADPDFLTARGCRVVTTDEAKANDYNLSPSRFIDLGDSAFHRPVLEIVADLVGARNAAATLDRQFDSKTAIASTAGDRMPEILARRGRERDRLGPGIAKWQ